MWLSALFLVKEENAHGDLSEGETVKVTARSAVQLLHPRDVCCRCSTRIQSLHLRAPPPPPSHPPPPILCRAGNR